MSILRAEVVDMTGDDIIGVVVAGDLDLHQVCEALQQVSVNL